MDPFSTTLPIQDRTSIQVSDAQCKSPESITHDLYEYPSVMTSWCFCSSSCGWFPMCMRRRYQYCANGYWRSTTWMVPGVPFSCMRCLNHRFALPVTLKRLASFAALKLDSIILIAISLSAMVRRSIALARYSFHEGCVSYARQFRYGQEHRQSQQRRCTVPPVEGVIFQRPIVELYKKTITKCAFLIFRFLFSVCLVRIELVYCI